MFLEFWRNSRTWVFDRVWQIILPTLIKIIHIMPTIPEVKDNRGLNYKELYLYLGSTYLLSFCLHLVDLTHNQSHIFSKLLKHSEVHIKRFGFSLFSVELKENQRPKHLYFRINWLLFSVLLKKELFPVSTQNWLSRNFRKRCAAVSIQLFSYLWERI